MLLRLYSCCLTPLNTKPIHTVDKQVFCKPFLSRLNTCRLKNLSDSTTYVLEIQQMVLNMSA